MINDQLMAQLNIAALILNSLYLMFYTIYAKSVRNEVLKPLSLGVVVIAIMFNYIHFEDPELVRWRYALITSTIMLVLLALPLFDVVRQRAKKYFFITDIFSI